MLTLYTLGVNIKKIVHSAHRVHVYFCVLNGSQKKTAIIAQYTINRLIFIPQKEYVDWAVRAMSFSISISCFKGPAIAHM